MKQLKHVTKGHLSMHTILLLLYIITASTDKKAKPVKPDLSILNVAH